MNGFLNYRLIWSPTGQCIALVQARNPRAAVRKAPPPWQRYLGEIYAVLEWGNSSPFGKEKA